MSDDLVLNHILNPSAPLGDIIDPQSVENDPLPQTEVEKKAKAIEHKAVIAAEENKLDDALGMFNAAIELAPKMASLYNNRAQLLRLMGDNERALQDIDKAIDLSNSVGRTAAQAYTQRALLHMLAKDEDEARQDFEKAGQLGGKFAACQAAKLNPYSKLCNQMLDQAMNSLL